MTRKAILYARVSTRNQLDNTSLDNQIEQCRKYAKDHGYQVVKEIAEQGSGAKAFEGRDGLRVAKSMAQRGQADVLVVMSIDRFMRGDSDNGGGFGTDAIFVEHELRGAGLEILYVNLPEQGTPAHALMKSMSRIFASMERQKIAERMRRGKIAAVKKEGKPALGGQPPFGYKRGENGYFEILESEAEIVRYIFKLYTLDGLSMGAIAKRLNSENVPTRYGGKCWWRNTVMEIVKRDYSGSYSYNSIDKEIDVPAIVSEDVIRKAKHNIKNKTRKRAPNRKYNYALSGRIKCECGYAMTGITAGKDKQYKYYRCQSSYRAYEIDCSANPKSMNAYAVEREVFDWVFMIFSSQENLEQLAQYAMEQRQRDSKPIEDRLHAIATERATVEKKLKRIAQVVINASDIELGIYQPQMDKLRKELEYLRGLEEEKKNELEYLQATEEQTYNLIQHMSALDQVIRKKRYDVDFRQKLLNSLDVQVMVSFDRKTLDITCILGQTVVELCNNEVEDIEGELLELEESTFNGFLV